MIPNEIAALPQGWEFASLGDVIELKYGKGLTKSSRDGGCYAVYGSNGVVGTHSNFLIENSCLVVGRKGSIGEVHISEQPCWAIDTTYYIDEFYKQPIEFWFYRLKALPLGQLNRASAIPGLNREDAYRLPIPLPPLNEQRRIVAKIEALKARSQKAKEELEAITLLLDQFRQSVLAAAFRGDLTADWREKNPDVEPASVLLERICAERRCRWEEAELEKMKASGKVPTDDWWKKRYKEPPALDVSHLPQLVDGWTYSLLEPLLSTKRAGLKTGPFGSLLKKHEHRANGIPVLGIENISSMGFVKGNKIYVDEAKAGELISYDAKEGDVLISRSGTVGEVCVVPSGIGEAIISTNLIRVCLAENSLLPDYFCFLFRGSSFILNQVSALCSGSTRDFLNQTILNSLIFPIPPWEEQQEIVQRIRAIFDYSNKIENIVSKLTQSLESLNQSILAKAFRGELVPQDPNDEPASVLLERIQAERAKQAAEAKAAKKSTGKTTGQSSRKAKQQDSESIQLGLPGLE
ncbi:restriction endonuclease subunit S [Aliterella atlantica]|uniref:restriction endonuclease subunit S n=1 Tax=Aliterella atlantica TaxID=1827278 RepID=UPI000698FF20|nr:restriction endonuclease subunit S [Aliterella atlantica]